MQSNKNWNCDNSHCRNPHGEVRIYPIGGGSNLVLCSDCWAYENRYNKSRQRKSKYNEKNFPTHDWNTAKVYKFAEKV